jgi:hypothetical protein
VLDTLRDAAETGLTHFRSSQAMLMASTAIRVATHPLTLISRRAPKPSAATVYTGD